MSDCTCKKCVNCCKHKPGWMTPSEAVAAMDAGLAMSLMMDWWNPDIGYGNKHRIDILCPASENRGGHRSATTDELYPGGMMDAMFGRSVPQPCIMLKDGLCTIHSSGFKPYECRKVLGCEKQDRLYKSDVVELWDSEEGMAVMSRWKAIVNWVETAEERV